MKKFILDFIVVIVLIYGGLQFYLWLEARKPMGLSDADIAKATKTVKCNMDTHFCSYFTPSVDSGSVKVTIKKESVLAQGLQVLLWLSNRKPQEAYAKYTNESGLVLFEGIPPGKYDINYGKVGTGPNNPGESYGPPVQVEIVQNQVAEQTIELKSKK